MYGFIRLKLATPPAGLEVVAVIPVEAGAVEYPVAVGVFVEVSGAPQPLKPPVVALLLFST